MTILGVILALAYSAALTAAPALPSPRAAPQRCAGSIDYFLRDEKGEFIPASRVKIVSETVVSTPGVVKEYGARDGIITVNPYRSTRAFEPPPGRPARGGQSEVGEGPETLHLFTACGWHLLVVKLEYGGAAMTLRFKNIPPDSNFYVDSLPFQEGEFVIDFRPEGEAEGAFRRLAGVELMSAEEKGKDVYLKELSESIVVSAKAWRRAE